MSLFDDLLLQIPDETDRAVFEKYPSVRNQFETISQRDQKNQLWLKENYDFEAQKTRREIDLEAQAAELQQRLAAAPAGGIDMTFDEMLAKLNAAGYDPKKVNEKLDNFGRSLDQRDLGVLKFWADAAPLPIKYKEEFGEHIDGNGFVTAYMQNPNAGANAVYEQFVAGKRAEKLRRETEAKELETRHQAELEKVRTETAAESRKQALMEAAQTGGSGIPVDQGRGAGNLGFLEQRIQDQRKAAAEAGDAKLGRGTLGDGSATDAIMAKIYSDRAAGSVQ